MSGKPTLSIDVDVTNPGQFYACCGLLELAERLWPGAEGWFDDSSFHVGCGAATTSTDIVQGVMTVAAQLTAETVPSNHCDRKIAALNLPCIGMRLDWWLDSNFGPNRFKTWAANGSSHQMFSKWLEPMRQVSDLICDEPSTMLDATQRIQGSYGFDAQSGWHALDAGFSLNEHAPLKKLPLRPVVELFGAIGLQRFHPQHTRTNDSVTYCTWSVPLTPAVAAPVSKGVLTLPGVRTFQSLFVRRGSFKGLGFATSIGANA